MTPEERWALAFKQAWAKNETSRVTIVAIPFLIVGLYIIGRLVGFVEPGGSGYFTLAMSCVAALFPAFLLMVPVLLDTVYLVATLPEKEPADDDLA
jgi:hypothetical protein